MTIDQFRSCVGYGFPTAPSPTARSFMDRRKAQSQDGVEVTVAVLDARESRAFFGVPMARRSIQPVWLRIVNHGATPYRLSLVASIRIIIRRMRRQGPITIRPVKGSWNSASWPCCSFRLSGCSRSSCSLPVRPIGRSTPSFPSSRLSFDRLNLARHTRASCSRLSTPGTRSFTSNCSDADTKEFVFTASVPGLNADYLRHEVLQNELPGPPVECDIPTLHTRLAEAPHATTNRKGLRTGDPANLVVVGEFATLLTAFGPRWDLTEVITLETCMKTFRAFLTGWEYRYSPVSALYLFGRSQDFALQRVRQSINERLHLRLWATPLRYQGLPVWIGQVSRDIGVRFTWRTWNLTTHRIDPNVDEARDYVVEDLFQAERIDIAGYVDGVGACDQRAPRHNLTGDPYYTDGKRAAVLVSKVRTAPKFVAWS